MAGENTNGLAIRSPDPDGGVVRAGREVAARRPRHGSDRTLVTRQDVRALGEVSRFGAVWSSEPEASHPSSDHETEPTRAVWPFRSLGFPPLVGSTRTTPLFEPMASQAGAASGPEPWDGCDPTPGTPRRCPRSALTC